MDDYYINHENIKRNLVYHYTKLETSLEKILPNLCLRMSPLRYVNDPKENKEKNISFQYTSGTSRLSTLEIGRYQRIMNQILLDNSRMLCFSEDVDRKRNWNSINLYDRGFYKLRMWAQYADNHRGVCLGINPEKFLEDFNTLNCVKKYRGSVNYTNSTRGLFRSTNFYSNNIKDEDFQNHFINEHIKEHRKILYFTKASDWKDENEYRYVGIMEDSTNDVLINISNSIECIFLGIDFPSVYIESLKKLIEDKDIKLYKLSINNGRPQIFGY